MPYKFGYLNSIQGRGIRSRVLLTHAEADWKTDDVIAQFSNYDSPFHLLLQWHTEIKPKMQKDFPLVNLPYLIDGVVKVGGENPILHYLSEKLGYFGNDLSEKSQVLALADYLTDMDKSCMLIPMTNPKGPKTDQVKEKLLPSFLKIVNEQILNSKKKFSVSDKVTLADILLVISIHRICLFWKSALNDFPEVKRVYEKLMTDQKIKNVIEAEFKLPRTVQGRKSQKKCRRAIQYFSNPIYKFISF